MTIKDLNRRTTDHFPVLVTLTETEKLRAAGVPWSLATLRKKKCLGEHPEFFADLDGRSCFNITEFQKWALEEMKKQRIKGEKRQKKLEALRGNEK